MSPTKYVAIPNPFTGNLDGISEKLEKLGGYNMHTLWDEGRDILGREVLKYYNLNKGIFL
jgi:hypothetical protein